MKVCKIACVWLGMAAALAGGLYRFLPRQLPLAANPFEIRWRWALDRPVVEAPRSFCVAELATYDDELFAYLMYHHFRRSPALAEAEVFLTYRETGGGIRYAVQARLDNDLLAAPYTIGAAGQGLTPNASWRTVPRETLDGLRHQTQVLLAAYSLPGGRKLETLSRSELQAYLKRFVRFKSVTDPRIRRKIEPIPRPLDSEQAGRLAADMIAVAGFYAIPLDLFLGIGAMENNYMNVPGDLQNAVWKKRAEKGDIVLQRGRGRVRVLNPSAGVWQITRETLRHTHRLYLADRRDYSALAPHLRPSRILDPDQVEPELLTTYAGLLLRELLDRTGGDLTKAAGAYNGGLGNPNPRYAEGVQLVASYARQVVETAASR